MLADCLHHARTLGATHIVDLATLTGGVVVALGDYHAGLMGSDQEWLDRVAAAGERTGEHTWQLPLHQTFQAHAAVGHRRHGEQLVACGWGSPATPASS